MGNNNVYKYNNQTTPYHHHFNQKNTNNVNIFLPIFCKLSLKDINLNNNQSRTRIKATDEPSSPKVSCMGQVKRNNRVTTFPITATPVHQHQQQQKYSRLKKLFSSKSLLPPAPNPASVRSKSCRASKDQRTSVDSRRVRSRIGDDRGEYVKVEVDIREMDPPLPVVKKAARDEVNIWKRRGMQGLQIDQIPLPNCRFQQAPPTV